MAEFNVRSDSVDVEQIMARIRARIREKRGVDYTEEEIRELAQVKLEKFLDPAKVRSDLVEHYRRIEAPSPPALPANYGFEDDTIYVSSRSLAGRLISLIRWLLNPILKLFFNPNPVIHVLHMQSAINAEYNGQFNHIYQKFGLRDDLDRLNYEMLNNLVVEMTRLGIEVKNLKMRVESLSSRLDFDERRARALEGVVQYRGSAAPAPPRPRAGATGDALEASPAPEPSDETGVDRRRRRRRRGRRRPGGSGAAAQPAPAEPQTTLPAEAPAPQSEQPDAAVRPATDTEPDASEP